MDIYAGARSPCLGELTLCADVILTVMDSQPLLVRVSCMDVWAAPAALKALWSVCVQGLMYQLKLLDHRWSHVSQKKKKGIIQFQLIQYQNGFAKRCFRCSFSQLFYLSVCIVLVSYFSFP